jgi:translation initiation factor IF-1
LGRIYLANAFSLNMLDLPLGAPVMLCVEEVDMERWVESLRFLMLNQRAGVDCVIGHESTARLAEKILNMAPWLGAEGEVRLDCGRRAVKMSPGDTVYVIQPRLRLPEGRILDYSEIVQLLRQGKLGFYTVHYGPC